VSRLRRGGSAVQNGIFVPLPEDWRSCILPVIGLATPVGLLLVNFSAWVISQLGAFRWGVAVSALISALILNSLTAINVYRYIRNRWPEFWGSRVEHENLVLVAAIVIVIVVAVLSALFSYVGMSNPKNLPNGIAVVTGFVGVVIPLGLIIGLNRRRGRSS
jgi:peptidoglycan/LPS O-acetylase OafA/YrhL